MEQMPHRREGIQNDLDKAYDEGHQDNQTINKEHELQEELRIAIDASNRVIAEVTGVVPQMINDANGETVADNEINDAHSEALKYEEVIDTAEKLVESLESLHGSAGREYFIDRVRELLESIKASRSRNEFMHFGEWANKGIINQE